MNSSSGRYALVIGEALVDLIEDAGPHGDVIYRPRYGGSPLNVAVGLRRLGSSVIFASAFGPDLFARRLRRYLADEGIEVVAAESGLPTVLAVAMAEAGHVRYEFFGSIDSVTQIPRLDPGLAADAAVVHGGSMAFNADPAHGTVLAAYRQARGFRTIDPNPRPFLIEDVATYRARLEPVFETVDLVKLSSDDASFLYPGLEAGAAVRRVRAGGGATVMMTRADRPTLVLHDDEVIEVPVPPIEPVDPTGAGDSFMACVLAAIVDDGPPATADGWRELARTANAAAAITCSAVGGAAAMPTRAQLRERLDALGLPSAIRATSTS